MDGTVLNRGRPAVHGSTQIFDNVDSLLDALVVLWKNIAKESIADHGVFHVALAGGGTPRNFYERLSKNNSKNSIAWDKVHFYFGDERYVPQDHVDSNFRMADETLFSKLGIPASQIHAMVTPSLSPEENAERYASLLDQQMEKDVDGHPVFDLVLLGMGGDGHTASLFPATEILHENKKWVAAQFVDQLNVWRVSLTYPTLNAARHVAILVVGEAKAAIFSELTKLSPNDTRYPIQGIRPRGDLQWFLDKAATRLVVGDDRS